MHDSNASGTRLSLWLAFSVRARTLWTRAYFKRRCDSCVATHVYALTHTHTRGLELSRSRAIVCACVSRVRIVRPCARIICVLTRSHGGETPPRRHIFRATFRRARFDRDQSVAVFRAFDRLVNFTPLQFSFFQAFINDLGNFSFRNLDIFSKEMFGILLSM